MRSAALALVAFLLAPVASAQAPAPSPAAKPQRLALVIGNGAYKDGALPNPINDAADMAKALESSGFKVIRRENATLKEMHLALREFGDGLGRQSTGLVYFAGHGMQVRGRNYLIPVDADIAREDEVAFAALDLGAVMDKLDSAKNPVNFVILDACRNNPFGNRLQATAKGLAQVDAPPGTLIAFATAPGSTAADGAGRNGLYTQHLVQQIGRPGAAVEEVFKAVRAAVRAESKNLQVPWESTSLESAFAFRAAPALPPVAALPVKATPISATRAIAPIGAPPAFAKGDSWTYRMVNELDQSVQEFRYRIIEIRDEEIHYSNGNVSDLVGNNMRIMRAGGKAEVFQPSTQFYVFPLKVGATWDLKSFQELGERKFDLKIQIRVIGEEEVEVPAGKMRALKIERVTHWKERNKDNAGLNTWVYWYNSGAKRYVRGEQSNVTTAGKVLLRERWELASFEVH